MAWKPAGRSMTHPHEVIRLCPTTCLATHLRTCTAATAIRVYNQSGGARMHLRGVGHAKVQSRVTPCPSQAGHGRYKSLLRAVPCFAFKVPGLPVVPCCEAWSSISRSSPGCGPISRSGCVPSPPTPPLLLLPWPRCQRRWRKLSTPGRLLMQQTRLRLRLSARRQTALLALPPGRQLQMLRCCHRCRQSLCHPHPGRVHPRSASTLRSMNWRQEHATKSGIVQSSAVRGGWMYHMWQAQHSTVKMPGIGGIS